MSGEGSSPPPRQSPYSPFPFGSPLGMSSSRAGDQKNFVSSETTANGTSLSSSTTTSPSQSSAFGNSIYLKGRVRAQEAYGGKSVLAQLRDFVIEGVACQLEETASHSSITNFLMHNMI